jgi:hypothetical protein
MKAPIKKVAAKKRKPVNGYDLEERIGFLISSGAIAAIGKRAIAASFKMGLSVTVLKDDTIYRLHPDGTKTAIKKLPRQTKVYTTGKMTIK